ncbi:MAG TPA: cysteine dioxygenase family protein, partial [Pyrinomonadaceae bacterium]|nr:cysteine dioxygenase family protein [Pyrinomonadaceae bacterium]
MSTSINIATPDSPKLPDSSSITFSELIERLNSQTAPPSLEQINSWLSSVEIADVDLEPYIGFKEGNYWRHRVCRNEAVEMLVICWRPGQKTPIHDHNGSHGVVKVQHGLMCETIFAFDSEKGLCHDSERDCQVGTITGADVPDIHRLGNPELSGQDLITIHVYAPPLGVLKTYKLGSLQIDLYTPNDFPT